MSYPRILRPKDTTTGTQIPMINIWLKLITGFMLSGIGGYTDTHYYNNRFVYLYWSVMYIFRVISHDNMGIIGLISNENVSACPC